MFQRNVLPPPSGCKIISEPRDFTLGVQFYIEDKIQPIAQNLRYITRRHVPEKIIINFSQEGFLYLLIK
jgi:hypothetical protein